METNAKLTSGNMVMETASMVLFIQVANEVASLCAAPSNMLRRSTD